MRSRSLRLGLLVTAVTVLLGLVVAEVAVRRLQPVPESQLLPFPFRHIEIARVVAHDSYLGFDQDLGWSQEPGARAVDDGIVFEANAAGFRADRDYSPEPPPGVKRLAAFGDSFIHCDEVALEMCWTRRIEEGWAGSEVLNFGIPASAPDQGLLRYRRDGRPYQPCAVLIGFQVENVNRVVNRYRPFYAPETGVAFSKPRFVLDGDGLRLLPNPVSQAGQLDDAAGHQFRAVRREQVDAVLGREARGPKRGRHDRQAGGPHLVKGRTDGGMVGQGHDQGGAVASGTKDAGRNGFRIALIHDGTVDGDGAVKIGGNAFKGARQAGDEGKFRPHHEDFDAQDAAVFGGQPARIIQPPGRCDHLLNGLRLHAATGIEHALNGRRADARCLGNVPEGDFCDGNTSARGENGAARED